MVGQTTATETRTRREEPVLTFRRFAIAFHLVATVAEDDPDRPREATGRSDEAQARAERGLASYEDDMLLYAHRDDAPFTTRIVPSDIQTLTVLFPPELVYESEGNIRHLQCDGAGDVGRKRLFRVTLAETEFKSERLAVLSVVLTPSVVGAEDSVLNEYDVIKLVKLWEGGEGALGAPSAIAEEGDPNVSFDTGRGERATLHELAVQAFPGWRPLGPAEDPCSPAGRAFAAVTTARKGYRVGTVELELAPNPWTHELFGDIAMLGKHGEAPNRDPEGLRWDRVVAVGGILQGLLDFVRIEDYELADVFAEVDVDPDGEELRAFHKGTLLSLSAEAEPQPEHEADGSDEERAQPMGVDAYLAVPNIVLLYSEQRLKSARLCVNNLAARQQVRFGDRIAIGATENGLSTVARMLAQQLPDVFHYPSERDLQQRGRESRGLGDLETYVRLRIDDLTSVLESRVRRRDRSTAAVGIAIGVVTAFLVQQAIEGRPLWLVFAAAVVLFAVFLRLRDRIF
jgi:hypothetical protein